MCDAAMLILEIGELPEVGTRSGAKSGRKSGHKWVSADDGGGPEPDTSGE